MLEEFENWFKVNEPRLRAMNCMVTITRPAANADNNCAYADIETENYLARATVWESGEFQKEALDPETGEKLLYEYMILHGLDELPASLEAFVEQIPEAVSAQTV